MAACIVAAIVVFGMSSFTTILTVFGIVVGLFNAFLGSSGSANEGNWFLSRIKHTLDVSNFLRVATVVVWLAAIGVVTYGVRTYYHEAQKVTLSGRVLTAGGDPAGNARVVLNLQNKKEVVTAADGTFTFANLDLSEEPLKKVQLEVVWKDLTTSESVDLATDRQRTINLPPGAPPFRVSYITLEGAAIDLLLRGQIDERWEERLGGQPIILPNSVSNSLRYLTKTFSVPKEMTEGEDFSLENGSGARESEGKRIEAKMVGKPSFLGSDGDSLHGSVSEKLLLSLTAPNQGWNVEIGEVGDWEPVQSLSFWRFAKREDLERENFRNGFDNYITKQHMPADFCFLRVMVGSCGGDAETVLDLVPRTLKLRVAVVENISPETIRIGKFLVRETKVETLRSREEEDSALKSLSPEEQVLFNQGLLKPGEKLLIALEMQMVYDKDNSEVQTFSNPPSKNERNNLINRLAAMEAIALPFGGAGKTVEIKRDLLLTLLKKPKPSPMLDKEYIFGPSATIDSVAVDNVNYPFRQYDVSKLVIRSGGEIGSCPFVYTYSPATGEWLNEGHILYGRNSSFKESTDETHLRRFDGRVIIKEEDPEQSFIDFVYIKVTLIDGREKLLYPLNSKLRFQDGDYLTMRQGDQIELQFDGPPNLFVSSYSIVSRGYYVPYAHSSTTGRTARLGEK